MAGLEISPTKVGFVIVKAREHAAKAAAWDGGATSSPSTASIPATSADDATEGELMGLIPDPPNLSRALRGETGTRLVAK